MIIKKNIGRIISTGFGMVVLGCGLNKLMEQTIDITEKGQYVNTLPLLVGVVGSVIGIKFIDIGIKKIENFETVFLNAGMLGEIKHLKDISIEELNEVYNLNVYANKELLDILMELSAKNIIIISSGASKNGYVGWGSYSLSKAGVNMLVNLYSNEMPNSKILAVAPGIIETPMTDYIRFEIDEMIFPSARKLKENPLQTPKESEIGRAHV